MRTILLLLSAALLLQSCQGSGEGETSGKDSLLSTSLVHNPASGDATQTGSRELPVLTFSDTAHAFGTIREGETVEHSFSFTNSGKAPLLITGASASCGCTVPDYPREPVPPGNSGVIRVSFNSKGKPGHQEKTVTVTSNTARGSQYLNISAEVTPAE
jgi:hypothetical protein